MSDIFLSFGKDDEEQARDLATVLKAEGYSVFSDRQAQPGLAYPDLVEREIEASKAVIVLWSKQSANSTWVRMEAEHGRRREVLVPVLLEETRVPLQFRSLQQVNLVGWRGELEHPGIAALLVSVRRLVAQPAAATSRGIVFVSYAREDRAYVEILLTAVEASGAVPWADNRIDYGERWWQTIVAKIRSCIAMVVVMTPASEGSKWVEREVLFADELGKPMFPLLLKGERFPLFVGTQYYDVRDGSLPPAQLLKALGRLTASPP